MFTLQLHQYLSELDAVVCSVHPGWMRTDMGGGKAPLDPVESARAILKLASRQTKIDTPYRFVDYTGKSFPI